MNTLMRTPRHVGRGRAVAIALLMMLGSTAAHAAATLTDVRVTNADTPGRLAIEMRFAGEVPEPSSFAVESPARISIDLPQTRAGVTPRNKDINQSGLRSWVVLEDAQRTRVVLEFDQLHPHVLRREGDVIIADVFASTVAREAGRRSGEMAPSRIDAVDFRRSETGAGQIQLSLSGAAPRVDVSEEGGRIVARFAETELGLKPQTLDVLDFATPVNTVEITRERGQVVLSVRPIINARFEQMAYQVGSTFTLELAPLSAEEIARRNRDQREYTGERINFSFQNVELRALLQIIADVAGKNLVVSDSVTGNLTLRLQNVPWDQALDIVLRTKGLSKNLEGDVLWVAPTSEVAALEKQELETLLQREELAPLATEVIQINYASAIELAELLSGESGSFLSDRGRVSVDERTSVLIVQDTREKLAEVRTLVQQLDVPVRQVLIEARIVVANDDFSRSLGVRAGLTGARTSGDSIITTSGSSVDQTTNQRIPLAPSLAQAIAADRRVGGNAATAAQLGLARSTPNIDLPASAGGLGLSSPGLALAILSRDFLLDLELSAIQAEGRGEVVSSPRVMTANGKEAFIEQGEEIPYTAVTATRVSTLFKEALLALRVTPQITPDGRIIMSLDISRDAAGRFVPQQGGGEVPAIDKRRLSTQVLVNDGETVVLGGVFEQTESESVAKVPLLGDIPLLGVLFRQKTTSSQSRELLIFVTPKIVNDRLSLR